ncbi:hypothetical protein [Actinophytocola sp.]|uniref:hypothetical protein n=1 Tax=Actinophytocola sp. TaxID=1872138 RepID=UPI003D6ADF9C
MAFEEKRAWIMLGTSVGAYAVYLAVVLGRVGDGPVGDVAYVVPLLWSIGGAIVAAIVLGILAVAFSRDAPQTDARDREIGRFGEYVGQSFVVIGGVAALAMAMLELDYFWIANTVYLCFVLSAILGSIAKIFAYRRGFHPW